MVNVTGLCFTTIISRESAVVGKGCLRETFTPMERTIFKASEDEKIGNPMAIR